MDPNFAPERMTVTVVIGTTHVAELIDGVQGVVTPEDERALHPIIDEDAWLCAGAARQVVDAARNGLDHTRACEAAARRAADEHRGRLAECEQVWRASLEGSWLRALIGYAGFLVCFAAEYAITLNTLPFVLDVDATSFLGMLLAAAPPAAMAVFDVLLVELIEGPWRRIKDAAQSWRKGVAWTVRAAALLVVLAGNLQMLSVIASAREEAVHIQQVLAAPAGAEGTIDVDQAVISRMVLYVSIWVTIDGALLLMFGHSDGRRVVRRALRSFALARTRRRQANLDRAVESRAAESRTGERRAADAEERVTHTMEFVKLTHGVHLQRVIKDRRRLPSSHLERVNQLLIGNGHAPSRVRATA